MEGRITEILDQITKIASEIEILDQIPKITSDITSITAAHNQVLDNQIYMDQKINNLIGDVGEVKKMQKEDFQTFEMEAAEEVETINRWGWKMFMAVFNLQLAIFGPFLLTFCYGKLHHHNSTLWWDLITGIYGMIQLWVKGRPGWFILICHILLYFPWTCICEPTIMMYPTLEWMRWFEILIAFRALLIVEVFFFLTMIKERMSRHRMRSIAILSTKFVVLTLFWMHLVACIFFAVAMVWDDPTDTWLGSLTIRKKPYDFKSETVWSNYAICAYYSMTTTTTVGYGDIHPVNELEMIVATVMLVINLVVMTLLGSYFIGPLLSHILKDETRQMILRRIERPHT